jgi:uncharacterized protein
VPIEFGPVKNAENLAKHGVSLAEGDGVLNDPLGLTVEDHSSEDEQRWITIGANAFGTVYVAVWTRRNGNERLISLRKPEPKERKSYETKR